MNPIQQSGAMVLVAHPSSDVYGADLQLVESVAGLIAKGHRVLVVTPESGPLDAKLIGVGANVNHQTFPVLRKSVLTPLGLVKFAAAHFLRLQSLLQRIRRNRPDLIYINTVTAPIWMFAAKITRVKTLCHVHEAEDDAPAWMQRGLTAQLNFANIIVVNSRVTKQFVERNLVRRRPIELVYNGIPSSPYPREPSETNLLLYTGRLSPRKGVDTLVEAFALLLREGFDAQLWIAGSEYPGYEWYVTELNESVKNHALGEYVKFLGYHPDPYQLLSKCTVAVVPSRFEPFGNTAAEAQMAEAPLVCSRTQGLIEIADNECAITFKASDVQSLFEALAKVLTNTSAAQAMARNAKAQATRNFGQRRYQDEIAAITQNLVR